MKHSENYLSTSKNSLANTGKNGSLSATGNAPIRAIAMILAHGVLRLQQRQKQLDNATDQSVHSHVLVTKGDAL